MRSSTSGSVPGLWPPGAAEMLPPVVKTRISPDIAQCPLGGKIVLS